MELAYRLAVEVFRRVDLQLPLLLLPFDFSTADASHAGVELAERLRWLLQAQP